jgi:pimeloyl-ACP methyl ester carboxylesterase
MRKTINIGNLRVSYLERNSENEITILFIHGNSQAATTFHRQLESTELSGYRLLALDLPGHGLSERSKTYSIPMMVKSITDFVKAMNLTNFILAGHSLGGHLSLQSLSEINPLGVFISGTPPLSKPFDPSGFRPHPKFGVFYDQNPKSEDLETLLDDLYISIEERTVGKYEFLQTDPAFRPALLTSIGSGEFHDEMNAWEEFKGKKRILCGDLDTLVNYEALQLKIPDTIIVNGGHNIHLDNVYTEILSQFMNEMIPMSVPVMREETLNG